VSPPLWVGSMTVIIATVFRFVLTREMIFAKRVLEGFELTHIPSPAAR
jgi:hypothetical protein